MGGPLCADRIRGTLRPGRAFGGNARFARTVEDAYYPYRGRYYCANRNDFGEKRCLEANSDIDLVMPMYATDVLPRHAFRGAHQTKYDAPVLYLLRRYIGTMGGNASVLRNALAEIRADCW